jgi:hypothetical protein
MIDVRELSRNCFGSVRFTLLHKLTFTYVFLELLIGFYGTSYTALALQSFLS